MRAIHRISLSLWGIGRHSTFKGSLPFCAAVSQLPQNPSVHAHQLRNGRMRQRKRRKRRARHRSGVAMWRVCRACWQVYLRSWLLAHLCFYWAAQTSWALSLLCRAVRALCTWRLKKGKKEKKVKHWRRPASAGGSKIWKAYKTGTKMGHFISEWPWIKTVCGDFWVIRKVRWLQFNNENRIE